MDSFEKRERIRRQKADHKHKEVERKQRADERKAIKPVAPDRVGTMPANLPVQKDTQA